MVRHSGPASTVRRRLLTILLMVLTLTGSSLAPAISSAQSGGGAIQQTALNQIAALLAEKDARTPTEQKVDSNLLYAFKQQTGVPQKGATLRTGVKISAGATTVVDITASVSDGLLKQIMAVGGKIISFYPQYRSIRAELPISQMLAVADLDAVIFIQPKQEATTTRALPTAGGTAVGTASKPTLPVFRAPHLPVRPVSAARTFAPQAAPIVATQGITASLTSPINVSEGDVTHRANLVRQTLGHAGTGIKTCVLSDGVNALAALQASGDLPAVTVVPGQAGTGNEGGAMLEIVHDLAPGAQLFYASAFNGIASFADNIKTLRNTYGCDVIVDDVSYFAETPFQLGQAPSVVSTTNGGIVTQAVNEVVADGAFYFSSAGNSGNLNDGTSGVWEGDFASAGASAAPIPGGGTLLDFDLGAGVQGFNTATAGSSGPTGLFWSDPLGGSSNDYDLFVLNATGTGVLGASTNIQTGTQDPFELVGPPGTGDRIVVVQRTGAANRYLHLNTNRGTLQFATSGQTGGHGSALQAYSVAATPAGAALGAGPTGPFPGVFSATNTVELFSSDGPRRHFFTADGTAITAGNFSATGGAVAQKPDITAADGVSCASPGFSSFFGTSAAAPHAAAIATLLKSAKPTLTNTELRAILTNAPTAIDIETAGVDRDSGAGIIDALTAMQTLGQPAVPLLTTGPVRFSEGPLRNNNGVIEAGETFALTVPLTNTTLAAATNVQMSVELLNPTPGVLVLAPGPFSYGTLAASGGTASRTTLVSLAPTITCGTKLDFKVTATYGGGGSNSPQVFFASLTLGVPVQINTTLDTIAPPPSATAPAYTTSTGTQTGRLFRSGEASSCLTNKANPGLSTAVGDRQYDAYTFTNSAATAVCVTVTLTTPQNENAASLFAAVYGAAGFVPATPDTNYLADAGLSGNSTTPTTFSFLAPAGQQFTVVVHEVNPAAGVGAGLGTYSLTLNGVGFGVCAAPPAQSATITATAGSGQTAINGNTFTTQLQATVRDAGGNPVPGVGVTFSGPATGAGVTFPNGPLAITNVDGQANLTVVANGTLGTYSVTANTSNGALATAASFSLTNKAGVYLPLVLR